MRLLLPTTKGRSLLLLVSLVAASISLDACSGPDKPGADAAETGGSGSGGRPAAGGTGAIDPDALSKNCSGLTVDDGSSCTKADLVCKDTIGSLCLCTTGTSGVLVWDCRIIGTPPSSGGQGGQGGEGQQVGGQAGALVSSGGTNTSLGGESNAGAPN